MDASDWKRAGSVKTAMAPVVPFGWKTPAMGIDQGDHVPRIAAIDPDAATGAAKQLLNAVKAKLGMTPNLMRTMANSPATLKGYLDLSAALAGGAFDNRFRTQIALAVAQANGCDYCLAAHTTFGTMAGLSDAEMHANRGARSTDPRRDAGLKLAHDIVVSRGKVSDASILLARAAGLSDEEMIEIVATVSLNILTNYVNHVAQMVVDFAPVDVNLGAIA